MLETTQSTLREVLIHYENLDLNAHLVDGKLHIGYGHLLQQHQSKEELSVLGCTQDQVMNIKSITQEQADALFDIDIAEAIEDAEMLVPNIFEDLSETRQVVVTSMCYQMGLGGVRKFKDFLKALRAFDYTEAAVEMLDSQWAREDSPNRAKEHAYAMEHDYFEGDSVTGAPTMLQEYDEETEEAISLGALHEKVDDLAKKFDAVAKQAEQDKAQIIAEITEAVQKFAGKPQQPKGRFGKK